MCAESGRTKRCAKHPLFHSSPMSSVAIQKPIRRSIEILEIQATFDGNMYLVHRPIPIRKSLHFDLPMDFFFSVRLFFQQLSNPPALSVFSSAYQTPLATSLLDVSIQKVVFGGEIGRTAIRLIRLIRWIRSNHSNKPTLMESEAEVHSEVGVKVATDPTRLCDALPRAVPEITPHPTPTFHTPFPLSPLFFVLCLFSFAFCLLESQS